MSTPEQTNDGVGFLGYQTPTAAGSDFNSILFLVQSVLGRIATATLVRVMAVSNAGALAPVGFVDILPLINQVDGNNNAVPHATVFHCPYFRLQGGANAIIIDPKVGDIGIAIFADHDISSVVANRAQSNPGSRRRFDMADGLYIGGVLNGTPTQYIRYSAEGIDVVSPTEINISAPVVRLHAATSLHMDCDGNGVVWTPLVRDDYVIGTTGASHAITPPQVP